MHLLLQRLRPKSGAAHDISLHAQEEGHLSYISHQEFMKMLAFASRPKDKNLSNVMAVPKRTRIFINTTGVPVCSACRGKRDPSPSQSPGYEDRFLKRRLSSHLRLSQEGGAALPSNMDKKP